MPHTPPSGAASRRASPPSGGSAHSALTFFSGSGLASGSGRMDSNRSEPSGRKAIPAPSPSTERVRRRAGAASPGSTCHSDVVIFVPSGGDAAHGDDQSASRPGSA